MGSEAIAGLALLVLGATGLKAKLGPLRPLAISAVPLGALLLLLGDVRATGQTAALWLAVAWLYNR